MTVTFPTAIGGFTGRFSDRGLAELSFPPARATKKSATQEVPPKLFRPWIKLTQSALDAILAGQTPVELPPLDLTVGTDFQQSVWRELGKIPAGRTRTYGEIARRIGRAKAVRAVGGACGANPIPVLVPCHRVLAANGKLGGFSSGLERKRELLGREGVSVKE